ncbi:MAG: V-type ATP synthase subunit A, partial [Candidatus Korarchaeota archaeon]|nr:V-type ATP synthase subunit A [Candidatus Korarchaeota archaeon]NIU82443.1 V-type ATP synthase subunit A [Candidatus Thorarchaeota archaeon]NIW12895.1 V-type ATP synthase subunit A [Candidatus Thorarchaeota archaeon]NIW53381.1 V-type ATP synthase subunit A [Candidatus Korarchaeota archaeon]
MSEEERMGEILQINGPLVMARGLNDAKIGDMVYLGAQRLLGEIVRIESNKIACQCYEDTSGVRPKEPVRNTGHPITAELGPGLVTEIFDGLQFSERRLWDEYGPFIKRGVKIANLDRDKKWEFVPKVKRGEKVVGGDILGTVPETSVI